jgi:dihydroorotase
MKMPTFVAHPKTMNSYLLKGGTLVNEGRIFEADLRIKNDRIDQIGASLTAGPNEEVLDCGGLYVFPGLIDDQVHFREPGLTHKATIATESKAAIAGGVTSFMEMPNTNPTTTNGEQLDWKRAVAAQTSHANYAFFFGATNENLEEVLRVDPAKTCGIKIFMGSSTGNMLVDEPAVLERVFASTQLVIATHCEDEQTVRQNLEEARKTYGQAIPFWEHPNIRSREACFLSSSLAIRLARKHGANLHILHLTTADELPLFEAGPMRGKKITAEVCVHHLWFDSDDYKTLGGKIKCNPAIKTAGDQAALWKALEEGRIDIVATDHAPHTAEEKSQPYEKCPAGLPLVQHSLALMLESYHRGKISLEKLVEKMCHNPADRFSVAERGYLREGYKADLAVADLKKIQTISADSLYYKCGWSPLEGQALKGENLYTFVNGRLVFQKGSFLPGTSAEALTFDRSNT